MVTLGNVRDGGEEWHVHARHRNVHVQPDPDEGWLAWVNIGNGPVSAVGLTPDMALDRLSRKLDVLAVDLEMTSCRTAAFAKKMDRVTDKPGTHKLVNGKMVPKDQEDE